MIFSTGVYLESLGNLFGFGDINLGAVGIPFTVFCVVGVMNAFNMMDGINGLCSGCAMLALILIGFYSGLIYDSMLVLIIGSTVGFIIFNLGILGKKRGVFLGDSGSNLIGFWVAWIAVYSSQNQNYYIEPITMLWFIAIPLLDCIGLIFSRIHKGFELEHCWKRSYSSQVNAKVVAKTNIVSNTMHYIFTGLFGIFIEVVASSMISIILFIIYGILYYIFMGFIKTKLTINT